MAPEDSSPMSESETSKALNIRRSSRRTQIVGQLTAGVYHDFNNILTVILAQAGMMELTMAPAEGSREKRSLDSIRAAAERGAGLARRLSEFRNRRAMGNKVCDLESTLKGVVMMLDRLLGDDIEITVDLCGLRSAVQADPALLEQALVELMMNAREAMPSGGAIHLQTSMIEEGEWAEIRVIDQGPGPSAEMLQRAGEIGYSTKEGRPGLGLYLVSSFIEESKGELRIEPGDPVGCEVRIQLRMSPLP